MKKAPIIVSIVAALGLVYVAMYGFSLPQGGGGGGGQEPAPEAVAMENGTQILTVTAKGGYSPRVVNAQANVPTKLRMVTKGSFDCSSAFTIPSLNIGKMLPAKGVTEFDIPAQAPGSEITARCSMGMYSFKMKFM